MLFLSSGEIYGSAPRRESGFTEEETGQIDPMNPRSCYPESKRAAETMVAAWVKQYDTDALVARLCHVYGPSIARSNSRADAQFLRKAVSGEDIVMKSDGSQVRSFLYVRDAAEALMLLCQKGVRGRPTTWRALGALHPGIRRNPGPSGGGEGGLRKPGRRGKGRLFPGEPGGAGSFKDRKTGL